MDTPTLRRVTGTAAVIGAACTFVVLPLYFVYDGPPPDWNILTRTLFALAGMTMTVVFITGFGHLVKRADPELDFIGALVTTAGTLWMAMAFVGVGLETGAAIQSDVDIDPTIAVSGTYILYGSISRILEALFWACIGFAVLRTRLLPAWTARMTYALAVINLLFVPSLFFGNTPANFYAANGWGTTATVGGLAYLALLAIGITLARTSSRRTTAP
ncbi:hypothetical protein LTV02_00750 [Nocardia yamanashiensis]|uniref:hypothetical protein n=1 Tax=Nocardia yamanashiensis TaxID=209247 RepID=UPI001E4E1B49|nr:hypothetical protein [Nocardia yamanashiensis]UGT41994.1 hypothetical protein LTV02_00750 [Nocardia yamanashiensis]